MCDSLRYTVLRFYLDDAKRGPRIIKTGLTLPEARAYCSRPKSMKRDRRGRIVRFDGFALQGD